MKLLINILVAVLALLAIASGIPKVMLMEQEVAFFGAYGFNNMLLIFFGISQLLAGVMLVLPKTRVVGAALLAVTFATSLVLLLIAGNMPMAAVTAAFVLLIGLVIAKSRPESNAS